VYLTKGDGTMESRDQADQSYEKQLNLPDRLTRKLMLRSRRGFLGWLGKIGIVLVGGGAVDLNLRPAFAVGTTGSPSSVTPDLGCPECTGPCSPCGSSCCCPCNTGCSCTCLAGCYECTPEFFQPHLLWILGYIPNCTCPAC
jgi:hypothetical protein